MRACFALALLLLVPNVAPAAPWSRARAKDEGAWREVNRLTGEQKFDAALEKVKEILARARKDGDVANVTEGLIQSTQLEMALHGYETAVRALKEAEWPNDATARVMLQLYYGRSLMSYEQSYNWEISKREKTASAGPVDLKAWTRAEIGDEIDRAFDAAMAEGAWLDEPVPEFFREYLKPNTYPPGVRPSLRDAVTYLAVEHLRNAQYWTPQQSNEVYKLGAARLLGLSGTPRLAAASASHPLERAVSWLADLRARHEKSGLTDGALEARYAAFEVLHASFPEASDKAAVVAELRKLQASVPRTPWWSRGQALLAGFLREAGGPGKLIDVRREALAGRSAFPDSPGGKQCAAIVFEVEQPQLGLQTMGSDSAGKRSILLNYRNLRKAYFRAYAIAPGEVLSEKGGFFDPDGEVLRKVLGETPAAAWSVDLPETKDYELHRHFVTPPALPHGAYRFAVSLREDFGDRENHVEQAAVLVGNLVVTARPLDGGYEVRTLDGETGRAVAGAKVTLYKHEYRQPPAEEASLVTDAEGYGRFPAKAADRRFNHFLVARRDQDLAIERGGLYFYDVASRDAEITSAFVYTDRSIYRPQQKISFKVLAYRGRSSEGRFVTAKEGETIRVSLRDSNYQEVGVRTLKLGAFGSASGEFPVPAGRALGNWTIQTQPASGSASIRVEEYKRPTFEASLKEAKDPLRLNRLARVAGEARYYFGQPVSGGAVRWRVTRTEVAPWWWEYWGWWRGIRRGAETVAVGTASVGKDGQFAFDFLPEADERKSKDAGTSYQFDVAVDVTDEGGETRSVSRVFRLGFVAVEARLDWEEAFFIPGASAKLRASLSDLDGKPLAGEGRFRLARLAAPDTALPSELPREDRVEERDAGEFALPDDRKRARWETAFRWETVTRAWKEAEKIAEGRVTHDAKGEGVVMAQLAKPGVYRLTYETKDPFGAKFEASRDLLVAGAGVNLPLIALFEKGSRKVGEKARLFVHSGLKDQSLTLEAFRAGKRLWRRTLRGDGEVIELPVRADDRGGFTVQASGVRDHQALESQANLSVPWSDRQLKVEFSTFRDKLRPGEKESLRVTVKGENGAPLEKGAAEVLAYMYDRSLDFFGPHGYPSVLGLYPSRVGAPSATTSLGAAQVWAVLSKLPAGPSAPYLQPDRLEVYPSYGIGGPGGRGSMMMADGYAAPRAAMLNAAVADKDAVAAQSAPREMEMAKKVSDGAVLKQKAGNDEAAAPTGLRTNFSETAFFAPHLVLGAGGSASVEFTAPESVTSWKVLAHAVTRDLRGGSAEREARTVKELMVRPYAPRFLREGDDAAIRVVVNDAGDTSLDGELTLDVENETTGQSAAAEFALAPVAKKFHVEKGASVALEFPLKAPRHVGDYAFRVRARAGSYSDGERRPFPVLPSRLHLVQSRFAALHDKDSKTLEFADLASGNDASLTTEKMVVTVDAQLFYGVLEALPFLARYPYECVEQTLNRFLSTGIVSAVFEKYPAVGKMAKELSDRRRGRLETFDEPDPNRRMSLEETPFLNEAQGGKGDELETIRLLDPEVAKAEREESIGKLRKKQLPSGAFPWFEGGPADEYMTLYVLLGLSRAAEFHVPVPKEISANAFRYLRSWLDERIGDMLAKDYGWESITTLNFALSSFPDASWTGNAFDDAYRRRLLDFSFKHWKEHAPLLKGYLSLTLQRAKREKDARLVWESVMDSAKHDDQLGTYWAREDRSWLWYRDEIDTHAFALRTQMELDHTDKHNEGLVQWLFLNKKLNHWKSTRATAEVIYALTHYLDATKQLGLKEDIKVELGGQTSEFHFDPEKYTGKKNQLVVPGEKVDPRTMGKVRVSKGSKGFAFASATWHFATDKLPAEASGDFFEVHRRFFRREHAGSEWRLVPLAEGAKIAVGDELEVQLSLRSKHEAEYVHLRDPRGAGFEPETVNSGWRFDLGIGWYEETRDSGSNFFFAHLPVGEYTFKYRVRANMAGNFRVGPAEVQSMYAPEFNAYSSGTEIRVEGTK